MSERRNQADLDDPLDSKQELNFKDWCVKHKLCTRCGGHGDCCRGCSGFAEDYPELFGSCGSIVKCPECLGTGHAEDQVPGREVNVEVTPA